MLSEFEQRLGIMQVLPVRIREKKTNAEKEHKKKTEWRTHFRNEKNVYKMSLNRFNYILSSIFTMFPHDYAG